MYLAFSTDAAPVVAAALLTAAGRSAVEDTVFENRFACAEGFNALGAKPPARPRAGDRGARAGPARVEAKDLRGGAALVVAALAAQGETKVYGGTHPQGIR